MALSKEDLFAISELLDSKLEPMKNDISDIKNDVSNVKIDLSNVKTDLSNLTKALDKNYDLLEEFYVYQKEHNTELINRIKIIEGEIDMHSTQIALNTSDLKRVK